MPRKSTRDYLELPPTETPRNSRGSLKPMVLDPRWATYCSVYRVGPFITASGSGRNCLGKQPAARTEWIIQVFGVYIHTGPTGPPTFEQPPMT